MEYVAKFNELSRFAPHQVATEEMKMGHFEQGLQRNIRSMIGGQTFENFQEMYQRAVKVTRVLEERNGRIELQTLGKEGNRGPRGETRSDLMLVDYRIKASDLWLGRAGLLA